MRVPGCEDPYHPLSGREVHRGVMKGRVLVAGFATRHIAQSAHAAGYEVYAVDHFCDQDLGFYTREARPFAELSDLEGAVAEMCERHSPDFIVAASGAEALATRDLCGTPKEKVGRFLDKLSTHQFFEETGIPTPGLLAPGNYPAMLKPRKGSGGWRNAIVHDAAEFSRWMETYGDLPSLSEEVVHGVPSSVCCLATGSSAIAVAANRQMLRGCRGCRVWVLRVRDSFPGRCRAHDGPVCRAHRGRERLHRHDRH